MSKGWQVADKPKDPVAERIAELDRLIAEQKARLAQAQPSGGMTAEQLAQVLAQQANATKELVQASRPVRQANPDHEHISVFSYPEGDLKRPKPQFLAGKNGQPREVFFNYHRESRDDLTPAEIDAYNAITHSCTAYEERGTEGMWKAIVTPNRLEVRVPSYTADERSDLPNGLVLILGILANGPKAADPAQLAAELAEMKRELVALKAQQPVSA